MRQRRWMKYLEQYDFDLQYHPGKANVVADALRRKTRCSLAFLATKNWEAMHILQEFQLVSLGADRHVSLFSIQVQPDLITKVIAAQQEDSEAKSYREKVNSDTGLDCWTISRDNGIRLQKHLFGPTTLREEVLRESHHSRLAIHPEGTKIFHDIARQFWWPGMKKDIAEFVSRCLRCQEIKAEHKRPGGLLQPLPVPEWKWEHITMDFVVGLPRSRKGSDAVRVIVDRLTKFAHFFPIRTTGTIDKLCRKYLDEILRLHGAPVSIISDRDLRFISHFWTSLEFASGDSFMVPAPGHFATSF